MFRVFIFFLIFCIKIMAQPLPAAYDLKKIIPLLKGKKVGLVVNQTSMIGNTHLVDSLLRLKIDIKTIFGPEHGFRGSADAGEKVNSEIDSKTGISVVSLYGKNKKPTSEQLKNIDILLFDIQDVGVRFYTYISTMHYAMEACAENKKPFIILDRPNPNGMYVGGCVLDTSLKSFVGMHPIPIVHGLTVGELAQMIVGEKWIKENLNLTVIPCVNYTHSMSYALPVKPSPNLPNDESIKLYASLCLFEGTNVSVARGTNFPFQAIGFPDSSYGNYVFTPISIEGMAKNPMHENKKCYGIDFKNKNNKREFTLKYVIDFYNKSKDKEKYFNNFFDKLIGNKLVKSQIQEGKSEQEITSTWIADLEKYKLIRKKYLIYP
ncbi:MAG: DUF1343 domain-containing protein [Cytophagales bacterium]|nr:MAG: DUF1343 domain-containing protein [Cytophagales bacterium]